FDITASGPGISAATGRAVSQIMKVNQGYPGGRTQQVGVIGPAQTIFAPAGGVPAAVTSVPGLGNLLSTVAPLTSSQSLTAIPGQVALFPSQPLPDSLVVAGSSTVKLAVTAHGATDA